MVKVTIVGSATAKRMKLLGLAKKVAKPKGSEVLTSYLLQMSEPPWTSYFVKVFLFGY